MGEKTEVGKARELSAKEVNKQMAAEWKSQKAIDRRKSKGAGTAVGVLAKVQKRFPGNPKKQIEAFMHDYSIYAGTGRRRQISEKTRSEYFLMLTKVVGELRMKNAAIQNIGEIGKKHCLVLIRYWTESGQSPSVVQNKISKLRCYLTWIGKVDALPTHSRLKGWLAENGVEHDIWAKNVAETSKAWEDKGVDFEEILQKVRAICEMTAIQLEVQRAFGLRMNESLHMNPRASDGGDFLRVVYGAKGGRPRDVPLAEKLEFDSLDEMNKTGAEVEFSKDLGRRAYQRDVLERAKLFADRNRRGILAHEGMTLKQNKRRFYYVLSRVGVTKGELGVSAHGLRHSYAAEIYEEEAGFAPPVSRRSPGQVTEAMKEADLHARQVVSLHTGHARPSISKAYVGSQTKLEKGRNFRIAQWLERTEGSLAFQNALRQSGVVQCWLGGSAVAGVEFLPHERLRIYVRFTKALTDARVHAHLVEQLERILDVRIDLSAHLPAHEPEDSMQVFVREDGGSGGRGGNLV